MPGRSPYFCRLAAGARCGQSGLSQLSLQRMPPAQRLFLPSRTAASHGATVDLDTLEAVQVARARARCPAHPRPHLLIPCARLPLRRTHGVSPVVSQLLLLHQAGATLTLCGVDPCLRLEGLFHLQP